MGRHGKLVGWPILRLAVPGAILALALATATPHDLDAQGTREVERRIVGDTIIVRTVSGSVWGAQPNLLDVFQSGGTYLGRVHAPADVTLEHLGLDALWGTVRGEYGEVYVVRLGLGPPPA